MSEEKKSLNFLEQIIEEDLANGLTKDKLHFRFPPEPNGYLHIGHAASICLNFGLGIKYNAPVNLRFDDTNPAKEEQEYVDAIKKDIQWLGFKWANELYSSDYFQQLYDWSIQLINDGLAYVDDQSSEEMAIQKGTPTEVGTNSPNRDRSIEENLELFMKMKNGEFQEGSHVLRAKIDMEHVNMHMRDPIMYRILKKHHHRTGDDWCIYPMYDWTHGESDYIEQISHSICTLEFKSHRELYDWYVDQVYSGDDLRPKQREFARRNLSYTVMSKRKLLQLVQEGHVKGWDDPRMPTISGLRRRGYTPNSIKKFSEIAGISKRDNVTDVALLEFCIKDDLNKTAPRVMAVLNPVKVVITNYPEGKEEWLTAENNPEDDNAGNREVPFSKELYIEKEDFREEANKKFFRLKLGKEVRLKNAYIIKAECVVKDENGEILEIHCTYDPLSRSGSGTEESQRRVKGTLHWVSIAHAIKTEVRLYDRLFIDEAPDSHKDKDFKEFINPNSLELNTNAFVEPSLKEATIGDRFQFQRLGYFCVDDDNTAEHLIFNRTVPLNDSWAKIEKKGEQKKPANNNAINELLAISGKYLKSKENDDRLSLLDKMSDLSKKIEFKNLPELLKTAASNKEYFTYLVVFNNSNALEILAKEHANLVTEFISAALQMKNSYVRYQAVEFIYINSSVKDDYITILKDMVAEERNSMIAERLELILN
ncbi:glutamine--tRNA ligase/YqeY domain fusion protein [Aureibaculum sp. A20]|uniref:Glutamine--tRNA ligase n=1 Tax=Aureibaculum flavum TaxID=2795986 RepID=A0ABS0WSI1_9FLAO|nr:glutamine--tRNA ligase/YqeY domain fusion protein [Aureibaculum flavum]MBJ2174942.1 glutamine--tRNA ligase/YqeY domain fusion protein [Aureibaculum flavum]